MPRARWGPAYCALLWLPLSAGCGTDDAGPEDPPEAAEPEPEVPEALLGTWNIVLGDADRRRAEVARLGLRDPPAAPEELARLDEAERQLVTELQTMVASATDGPGKQRLEAARAAVAGVDAATLVLTRDHIRMTMGEVEVNSAVKVRSADPISATLRYENAAGESEVRTLMLIERDALAVIDPGDPAAPMRFERP